MSRTVFFTTESGSRYGIGNESDRIVMHRWSDHEPVNRSVTTVDWRADDTPIELIAFPHVEKGRSVTMLMRAPDGSIVTRITSPVRTINDTDND